MPQALHADEIGSEIGFQNKLACLRTANFWVTLDFSSLSPYSEFQWFSPGGRPGLNMTTLIQIHDNLEGDFVNRNRIKKIFNNALTGSVVGGEFPRDVPLRVDCTDFIILDMA